MVPIGQRRVTEAFAYLDQAAVALGTNPAGAARKLRNKGIEPQALSASGAKARKVVPVDAVARLLGGDESLDRITSDWVGTTDAAGILGTDPPNVEKLLTRRDVKAQFLTLGTRKMRVYPRTEVERVSTNGRRGAV